MKKMKDLFRFRILEAFAIPALILFSGCEKVINVDLNEAAPKIVIEGLISDKRGPYTVTISKTASYFNQPELQKVSGAIVVITDDFDNIDTLKESRPGAYVTSRVRGIYGRTYQLKVVAEGEEYTGSTTLAEKVNIDSLRLRKSELEGFDFGNKEERKAEIHCFFMDPLTEKNYYRIKVYKNDSINTESYRLYDDQYSRGLITELRISFAQAGNTYRVELLSLDKSTYTYYNTLGDLMYTNPFFGSTPANPISNLSNGALGYFGSYAISSRTIVVTEDMINSLK
jgi:hypothetical protein